MKIALVSNGKPFNSMLEETIKPLLDVDFRQLEEHICGLHTTLLLLDEVMPKEKKKPFYQTLHKHPKFVRK